MKDEQSKEMLNDTRELTDGDLEKAAGGYFNTGATLGFMNHRADCPKCGPVEFRVVSVPEVINGRTMLHTKQCKKCGRYIDARPI